MFGIFKRKQKTSPNDLASLMQETYAAMSKLAPHGENTKVDIDKSVKLAQDELLSNYVSKEKIFKQAQKLLDTGMAYSTEDLALSTSLVFFKDPSFKEKLSGLAQMNARITMIKWVTEGKVNPLIAKAFEHTLYKEYKP